MKKNIELRVHLFVFTFILLSYPTGYLIGTVFSVVESRDPILLVISRLSHNVLWIMLKVLIMLIPFYFLYFLTPRKLIIKNVIVLIIYASTAGIVLGLIYILILSKKITSPDSQNFLMLTFMFSISGALAKKYVIWRKEINKKALSYKKLLESKTALLMLQAQLNPHFLFNSLNNIDILIKETPDTASEYLKKLSDILRYVLYETKETETELSKEIDQIKSYIELQKIRTDNPHYVNFNIKGEIKDQKIAPMIFIPFVENAFKHCKNKTIENAIDIEFEIKQESIKMICKNYYEESRVEVIKSEGLGVETIKQRLNLLYPNHHELIMNKTDNWFNVSLSINQIDSNF